MRRRHRETFTTIKTEGNLLPIDLLQRIAEGDGDLDRLSVDSYYLTKTDKVDEGETPIQSAMSYELATVCPLRHALCAMPYALCALLAL